MKKIKITLFCIIILLATNATSFLIGTDYSFTMPKIEAKSGQIIVAEASIPIEDTEIVADAKVKAQSQLSMADREKLDELTANLDRGL